MDDIERKVKVPPEAGNLDHFARTYAFVSPDRVWGFYFVPQNNYDSTGCKDARKYEPMYTGGIALFCPPPDGMAAGERRWFSKDDQPDVTDGGCDYMYVDYDVKSETIIRSRCHGIG